PPGQLPVSCYFFPSDVPHNRFEHPADPARRPRIRLRDNPFDPRDPRDLRSHHAGDLMARTLLMTGTGTDVGKTVASLAVLLWARSRGLKAAYLKPVQCGSRDDAPAGTFVGDAEWLQAALGDA